MAEPCLLWFGMMSELTKLIKEVALPLDMGNQQKSSLVQSSNYKPLFASLTV